MLRFYGSLCRHTRRQIDTVRAEYEMETVVADQSILKVVPVK